MIKKVVFWSIIVLTSCTKSKIPDKENENNSRGIIKKTIKSKAIVGTEDIEYILSSEIDKVEIHCLFFGEYQNKYFDIILSNYEFSIVRGDDENNIIYIDSARKKKKLIKYINDLYIDKTNKIVSDIESKEEPIETDYPFIRVIGEKENVQIFKKDISLRNHIVFSPYFIEFYEFLDSLANQ